MSTQLLLGCFLNGSWHKVLKGRACMALQAACHACRAAGSLCLFAVLGRAGHACCRLCHLSRPAAMPPDYFPNDIDITFLHIHIYYLPTPSSHNKLGMLPARHTLGAMARQALLAIRAMGCLFGKGPRKPRQWGTCKVAGHAAWQCCCQCLPIFPTKSSAVSLLHKGMASMSCPVLPAAFCGWHVTMFLCNIMTH